MKKIIKNFYYKLSNKFSSRKYYIKNITPVPTRIENKDSMLGGLPIHVRNWGTSDNDHCYLADGGGNEYKSDTVCPNCGSEMKLITQVESASGDVGLQTSICGECWFVKHTRNKTQQWYSEHFKNSWLINDSVREAAVSKKEEPAKSLSGLIKGKKSVLDVGCGIGDRLAAFKERGFSVFGCEPSQHRAKIASEFLGEDIYCGGAEEYFSNFSDRKYDVIYFFCVLAFIENPFFVLNQAVRSLNPGGYIYIRDGSYFSHNMFHNAHLGVLRSFFHKASFLKYAQNTGLKVVGLKDEPAEVIFQKTEKSDVRDVDYDKAKSGLESTMLRYIKSELNFKRLKKHGALKVEYGPFSREVEIELGITENGRAGLKELDSVLPVRYIHEGREHAPVMLK